MAWPRRRMQRAGAVLVNHSQPTPSGTTLAASAAVCAAAIPASIQSSPAASIGVPPPAPVPQGSWYFVYGIGGLLCERVGPVQLQRVAGGFDPGATRVEDPGDQHTRVDGDGGGVGGEPAQFGE